MLSQKDAETLEKIKSRLVLKHKDCKGRGYLNIEGDYQPCLCMNIFKYIIELQKSGIPQDYWELHINDLKINNTIKKEIKYFIKYLDNAVDQGQGILFTGRQRGVGKTSLACEIGKEAIIRRHKVYFTLMQNIVSDKFTSDQNINEKIKSSDLVIIDEFDKVMMSKGSSLSKGIENFLREILPIRKSIILCSNSSIDEIEKDLNIESLIRRYMQIINVEGKDFSFEKNKQLKDKLKKEVDYFSDNIKNSALQFLNNENLAYEREFDEIFGE